MSRSHNTIVLKSADGALFRVAIKEIQHSILLRNITSDNTPIADETEETTIPEEDETEETTIPEEDETEEEAVLGAGEEAIPLANVSGPILKKVIEWLRHHQGDAINEEEEGKTFKSTKNVEISDWDAQFTNVDQGTLFDIVLVSAKHI
jgi:hypothetical protein